MHQQVGIAADRRGEVRILFQRQPEVADIGLLIHGLSQRADHQALEQQTIRPRRQPLHQLAKFAGGRLFRECRAHLQCIQHLLQFRDALVLRLTMHSIQTAGLGEAQRHRRFHIGGDHALLDQAVRVVARHRIEAFDPAVAADTRLHLAAAEIESAARVARRFERAVDRMQRAQRCAHRRRQIVVGSLERIFQVRPGAIVGEPRVRANHRLVKLTLARLAVLADAHVADECQPFHPRHQRTQMIRQVLRQHRNDAIRKVHGGCTRACLDVQCAPVAHVVADVGDGDHEPPAAAAQRLGVHGIVEILGVRAVDGHQRHLTQVLAALPVGGLHVRSKSIRLEDHLLRKLLRQIMAKNREARRQVGRPQIFQHFDDAPVRRVLALRAFGHFNDDRIAVFGAVPIPRRHFDAVPVTGVFGRDVARNPAAAVICAPDAADARGRVADPPDQACDSPSALVDADGKHFDAVAVHERCGIGARQHQGRRAVIRYHQHFAAGAPAHPTCHPFAFAGGRKAVWSFDGLPVAYHRRQALGERFALRRCVQPQPFGEARGGQRLRGLRQMLQQQFAAGDGIGVARLLQLQVRILAAPVRAWRAGLA